MWYNVIEIERGDDMKIQYMRIFSMRAPISGVFNLIRKG
jgi:hypothetical protein